MIANTGLAAAESPAPTGGQDRVVFTFRIAATARKRLIAAAENEGVPAADLLRRRNAYAERHMPKGWPNV